MTLRRAQVWVGMWVGVAAVGALPSAVVAHQQDPPDPAQRVDSTEMLLRARLRRLSRGPGADSLLFARDSADQEARALEGRRSGSRSADSTMAALMALPGYELTEYRGERAEFEAGERLLFLHGEGGEARVLRDGNVMTTDSTITYSEVEGVIRAGGAASFTPKDANLVESTGLIFDLGLGRGTAYDAKTRYGEGGANWIVTGDLPSLSPDEMFGHKTRFTSCEEDTPHYHFEADEVKIKGGGVLVAKGVRLYFADVPVAWLPFIAQSLSQGRASGILTPRFSVNDIVRSSAGYRRRVSNVGFYWAMSDYTDAVLAMDWFSESFIALTGSFGYRINRQFLSGDLNFRRYWRSDGSSTLAFDTRHSWEMDERTQLRVSGRFSSSTDFVREFSTNPREVTQAITSEGGADRRFDWGSVSLSATRQEYLSDDRLEWTLPSARLSLSTITLFRAPSSRARFWNNMTWSGSANVTRQTREPRKSEEFDEGLASTVNTNGGASSSVSLGRLSVSQSLRFRQRVVRGFPDELWPGARPDSLAGVPVLVGVPAGDIGDTELNWTASVNYQQNLIGSTTLTPNLSVSGRMFRGDTVQAAQSFVSAPSRLSFGARLKTDVYGFFPGFGSFDRIRHKVSPSFDYQWSPAITPTELQRQVFRGARDVRPTNTLSVTLNQTLEAKRNPPEADSAAASDPAAALASPLADASQAGPRRLERGEIVNLLALRTSVIRYNFVEADSLGSFLAGFETTRLSNQISSDFLRGLSLSMNHDLFEGSRESRKLKPHLSNLNLGFSLGSTSGIVRWLGGLFGRDAGAEPAEIPPEEPLEPEDPFAPSGVTDEASIVPRTDRSSEGRQDRRRGNPGQWSANLSYALQRPRGGASGASSQMLSSSLSLRPTDRWNVSWRTSYDLERGGFNDHSIRLSRDLHRWQANFDFLQTATGNWTFRFEVSLLDNADLKVDYEQRNLDVGRPAALRR